MDPEERVVVYGGGATTAPGAGGGSFFSYAEEVDTCLPRPALEAVEGVRPIPGDPDPEADRVWEMSFAACQLRFIKGKRG
jgi:hypothetical protein